MCGLDHFCPRKFSGAAAELISGSLCACCCFCCCVVSVLPHVWLSFPGACAVRTKAGWSFLALWRSELPAGFPEVALCIHPLSTPGASLRTLQTLLALSYAKPVDPFLEWLADSYCAHTGMLLPFTQSWKSQNIFPDCLREIILLTCWDGKMSCWNTDLTASCPLFKILSTYLSSKHIHGNRWAVAQSCVWTQRVRQ